MPISRFRGETWCESSKSRCGARLTSRRFATHNARIDSAGTLRAAKAAPSGRPFHWPRHAALAEEVAWCRSARRRSARVASSKGRNATPALPAARVRARPFSSSARSSRAALPRPSSRHAILRFHANAARASISLDTLPHVMRLCFPRIKLKEHRQDGFFELPNGARIWVGGLDDKERVEKILGLEYVSIFLNEASQIPYASALVAFTRLAQTIENVAQRAYVDLNPVAKSHWTNLLFGEKRDPDFDAEARRSRRITRAAFVNPRDNEKNLSPAVSSKASPICRSGSASASTRAFMSTSSTERCGPTR